MYDAIMKLINKRCVRKHYFDKVAAQDVHNTTEKAPLTESPFVCIFEFWGSNGYWCGNHMDMNTEDCIDFLAVIFEGRYTLASKRGKKIRQSGCLVRFKRGYHKRSSDKV